MKRFWLCGLISMGFGSDLQGRLSHDALISRQDAELRLLENMKRCITLRIKCEREYAITLLSVCIQAQKSDPVDELQDSQVAKAWNIIIEETEAVSRIIRHNADHLALNTLDSLNNLISEKRALRKMYLDEHSRIYLELTRLQDALNKTKAEYEKCMEMYKVVKAKYEDQYVRGKINKKLDEARDRYLKLARRLHILHNEYVLLVCEAADYEQHLRMTILPALLDYQQIVLQEAVESWKNILNDFIKHTDITGTQLQATQNNLRTALDGVNGKDEYVSFSQNYKSSIAPSEFLFDESIHDNYTGKLKPKQLTVDEFTFDLLKARQEEFQERLNACQTKLKEKQHQLKITENEMNAVCQKTDTLSTRNVKKRATDILKRDILELECNQRRTQKLLDMIDRAMLGVNPEELPLGLQLDVNHVKEEAVSGSNSVGKSAKFIVDKLLNPFQKRQGSNESKIPKSPSSSKRDLEECSCSATSCGSELLTTSDGYTLMTLNPYRTLQDEDWFHGVLPREEVVRLLAKEGDYLVRETVRNEERQLVLSLCWQGHKHFIIQTTPDGKYRFEGPAFASVQELVLHQHQSGLPVTSKSGAIMKNPVLRERWELNNDDVELIDKIGRGNFGDVYKAKLLPSEMEIAVKTCRMNLPDEQRKRFLQEGRILKQYDHPNIVKFIGICVQKQPIMIVMELVPGGSLLNMLRTQGANLVVYDLLKMCIDTASGMEYLESKNCIHRDLAARNCLVGRNNIVKISDFGMSREEEEYIVSDGMKQIPIKWTAPEALNFGKYTSLCDVWSYGILMWEVFSLGSTPYCGLSNTRTRELIDSGYRLQAPDNTPNNVYEIMLQCWEYEPDRRPHFVEIRKSLEEIAAGQPE